MNEDEKSIWMNDGILYAEYINSMSTPQIVKREEIAVKMLNDAKIEIIPFILILKNIDRSSLSIKLSDWGKILNANGFMKRVTGIWVVGAPNSLKFYVLPIISPFFGKRFYFIDSLEEAVKQAKKSNASDSSLLE